MTAAHTPRLRPLEITDLIGRGSADGPADAARELRRRGQRRAARLVGRLPAIDGRFDRPATDHLLLRVHYELQRLEDELSLARLVVDELAPLVDRARRAGGGPVRVVDVGCGIGFLLRSIAAHRLLGDDVELVGVDLNGLLVDEAARLAAAEGLPVRFVEGDAFEPGIGVDDPSRTVVISSGVTHHFDSSELPAFFAGHERTGVAAFAHWDLQPSAWAVLGSWLFHRARMRLAVARHDGVMSTRRAHRARTLVSAAREGAPSYTASATDGHPLVPNPLRILRPVVGFREGRA